MWARVMRNGAEEHRKEAQYPERMLLSFGIGKLLAAFVLPDCFEFLDGLSAETHVFRVEDSMFLPRLEEMLSLASCPAF